MVLQSWPPTPLHCWQCRLGAHLPTVPAAQASSCLADVPLLLLLLLLLLQ